MRRCEPSTLGTKRVVLMAIIPNPPPSRSEEMRRDLLNIEELRRSTSFAGKPLDEYMRITDLVKLCVKDVRDQLEMANKGMRCPEVRQEIMSFLERRRDTLGGPRPMDVQIGAKSPDHHLGWWGGADA